MRADLTQELLTSQSEKLRKEENQLWHTEAMEREESREGQVCGERDTQRVGNHQDSVRRGSPNKRVRQIMRKPSSAGLHEHRCTSWVSVYMDICLILCLKQA